MKALLIGTFIATNVYAQITNSWVTRPASPGTGPTTLAKLVQYPEAEARAKHEMEVAFFCDVDEKGKAANFQLYRPDVPTNSFVAAVRKALDAATFEPAISAGRPVMVQLGASVLFKIENGWPVPVVRLNVSDKSAAERDYIGPQLIGGQPGLLHDVVYPDLARARRVNGVVNLAFDIDTFGRSCAIRVVGETPAGHGFGESAVVARA